MAKAANGAAGTKSQTSRLGGATALLVLSIVFHTVYLGSIFDIYFVSPVTRVGVRYGVGGGLEKGGPGLEVGEGLAKRVVLIVGDGLRADKLFQQYPSPPFSSSDPLPAPVPNSPHAAVSHNRTTPAPFVRNLIQTGKAQWGVSHTRVPTESRPGHVALIGGMYEDVSAVTRGWQTNPVSFDSVFNQSSHTFSFGSPDILPMFKQGASDPDRVDAWSYGEEFEDFSADAVHLDLWVLDQLKTLLQNSTTSPTLDATLRAPGTVFFLHLLGLDTTGHSYRPHGPEYHRNIRVLDYVVEKTVQVLNDFFGDDETAFVLTADHGMSSKGNHGDGEPDNTRTPLVTWGAGIKAGLETVPGDEDAYSADWGLKGTRRDVEQADVAVLMSILGGLAIPANSAGSVPLDILDATPSFKARAAYANANQLLAEFTVKSDLKEKHAVSYTPFPGLVNSFDGDTKSVEAHRREIEEALAAGRYDEVQAASRQLVRATQEGIRYFQTYDWLVLRSIVTLGYIGFVVYSANFILRHHVLAANPSVTPPPKTLDWAVTTAGLAAFASLSARFIIERSSMTYYLYAIFPCYFWTSILKDPAPLRHLLSAATASFTSSVMGAIFALGGLELMVYGYMDRRIFSALLLVMGVGWPLFGMSKAFRQARWRLLSAWAACSLLLAIFPLLPVEKGESILVILVGAGTFVAIGALALTHLIPASGASLTLATSRRYVQLELALTVVSAVVTASSAKSLQDKQGLPRPNQVIGWLVLVLATLIPVAHGRPKGQPVAERLFVLLFAFAPIFIILSLSYEALFYATFAITLALWVTVETRLAPPKKTPSGITSDHVRVALFFLSFLHVAFFGVGNVASISSFYLEPVYRLIPVFAPFPMAALLLFKLLIPFVALSAVSSVLTQRLRLPPFSLFIIASTLSDVLALNFFFLVTDQGSWLEIGSTITNFAICSLLGIFNTALFLLGEAALENTAVQ